MLRTRALAGGCLQHNDPDDPSARVRQAAEHAGYIEGTIESGERAESGVVATLQDDHA